MTYHRAKEIFSEAVKLAPEDRGAYLDEHCGDDADLRAQVEQLLLNHSSTVKDQSPQRIAGEYQRGDTVAHFTIRDQLGSGGMGAVYLAEQTTPVRRQVALKVIKPGFDTRNTLARFQAERQALARMDHPCVAKVLEAGATETGRPWFAMEYIKGQQLNTYCDENKLDTTQRLGLFIKICEAVQHAHQKGIMHRDLKPGNILVTRGEHDEPQPKVIDFGIAKAVSGDLTDMTLHTAIEQLVGTLAYMSPEQVRGSDDIDTRTDVYTLGVILYELLSGKAPFTGETTSESGQEAMKKSIREADPPKPSMQLSSVDNDEATAIAQARGTDTTSLQNTLRRELEWIPLKALRKDRRERYATPEALAADVQRYLDGEALEAGPITRSYRLRKFVKRNKVPVFTAASFLLLLIAATVISLSLLAEADRQRLIAEQQSELASQQQAEADRQSGIARQESAHAKRALDQLESWTYFAHFSRARMARDAGNTRLAQERHAAAEQVLEDRGFENLPIEFQLFRPHGFVEKIASIPSGYSPSFSPDGTYVSTIGYGDEVSIFDAVSMEQIGAHDLDGWIGEVALSPGASHLAVERIDGSIELWDIAGWKRRHVLEGGSLECNSIAFNHAGNRLVCGHKDGSAILWDANSGERIDVFRADTSIMATALSPDGTWLAASTKDLILLWHTGTKEALPLEGHQYVTSICFSLDSTKLATSSQNGEINLWDLEGELPGKPLVLRSPGGGRGCSIALNQHGTQLASCGTDSTIRLWNAIDGSLLGTWQDYATAVSFTHDDSRIITAGNEIQSWVRLEEREQFGVIPGHDESVFCVAFSPDGSCLASASGDHTMRMWDARTGSELAQFHGHDDHVLCVAFNGDGTRLATGSWDGTLRLWDARTGEAGQIIHGYDPVRSIAFSPDGRTIAYTGNDEIWLWDLEFENLLRRIEKHGSEFSSIAFSPDGSHLASAGIGLSLWNVASGEEVEVEDKHEAAMSVAFNPQGNHLASAGVDGILLWDTATHEVIRTLRGHQGEIHSVQFSPDGTRLVSSGDTTVRLWDVATGEDVEVLRGHDYIVRSATFSHDGTRLASASEDDTIRLWDGKPIQELVEDHREAAEQATTLEPLVESWMKRYKGNSNLVLAELDRETRNRTPEEATTLRNLVLKKLVEFRQANATAEPVTP